MLRGTLQSCRCADHLNALFHPGCLPPCRLPIAALPLTSPPKTFIFCPAPPQSPPEPIPSQHKTPGWPPGTAQQRSAPSRPRSWRDVPCNQRPAEPPVTRASPPGNNRPAPARNFHAGNSARHRQQKSITPSKSNIAGPLAMPLCCRGFTALENITSAQPVLIRPNPC